ncbi:MAG: TetR/AcrR family transcriptional regulator [Devosia sp.]
MSGEAAGQGGDAVGESPKSKPVRADAQRSLDALLQAAKVVFATSGVDAPVREIAETAGVGVGTVYRHFPQRSDLVAAVFKREVDACADAAAVLAAAYPPEEALAKWLERFTDFIATKRGLAPALHSGNPAFEPLPAYFKRNLVPALRGLLDAAVVAGEVRADIDAGDLLNAVANLSHGGPEHARPMVALLVDGLRYGAGRPR